MTLSDWADKSDILITNIKKSPIGSKFQGIKKENSIMYVQAGGMGGVVVTENSKGGKKIKEHSSSKAGHNKWKELRKTKTAKNIEKISCWQVV